MHETGFFADLRDRIDAVDSVVSVGLDPDPDRLPDFLDSDLPRWAFNRRVIDATHEHAACYKPNAAFYEDPDGWRALTETIAYAHGKGVPVLLDAKRGDIGNTARRYADLLDRADAITVNPYLGRDSLEPFLSRGQKGVFVLARTSNAGARDFQELTVRTSSRDGTDGTAGTAGADDASEAGGTSDDDGDGNGGVPLYAHVARRASEWNGRGNVGLVVGATAPEELSDLRERVPELPFLVPGVGAQGGDAEAAVAYGLADGVGLINSSRGIIFAGEGSGAPDAYFGAAGAAARRLKERLNECR